MFFNLSLRLIGAIFLYTNFPLTTPILLTSSLMSSSLVNFVYLCILVCKLNCLTILCN